MSDDNPLPPELVDLLRRDSAPRPPADFDACKRLGWPAGILNGPGGKPKAMHWRTFRRLVAEHDTWVAAALAGMGRRLGLINGMLAEVRDRTPRW